MAIPDAQLTHVGIYARDVEQLAAFYERHLGMVRTDDGVAAQGRKIAFLSRRADEHHQLVMIETLPGEQSGQAVRQLSFRVSDLAALKHFHREFATASTTGVEARNHGNSWSIYLRDPEGNVIEIYAPTPWYVSQPFRAPLDLAQPDEAIVEITRSLLAVNETARPVQEWEAQMHRRLGAAT
ncbi:MAG: VOC family protein [Lautropia sp.]